jgi:hypothetical protein
VVDEAAYPVRQGVAGLHRREEARGGVNRGPFFGKLFAHPFKNAFGGGEFIPLGLYLRWLLGQLFFAFVPFRAPRGDPFQ